jgi:putative ABC transport system permease protein
LMSDANFRKLYPRQEGFRVFLIDTPPGRESDVANLLETGLSANGFTATRTTDKVAAYQAVVGAYLTTFQLLGGFALLLAVLGLGVVVLRSVWERVGELALLRAVGYKTGALQTLILTETLFVLLIGLGVGVLAAVASVLPNLALGGSVPWVRLALLLVLVSAAGLVVAVLATAGVARVPLIPALRKD